MIFYLIGLWMVLRVIARLTPKSKPYGDEEFFADVAAQKRMEAKEYARRTTRHIAPERN